MKRPSSYYELPITSERAELLGQAGPGRREQLARGLLSRGEATLLAVAIAYYGGDMAAAKRALYGITPDVPASTMN